MSRVVVLFLLCVCLGCVRIACVCPVDASFINIYCLRTMECVSSALWLFCWSYNGQAKRARPTTASPPRKVAATALATATASVADLPPLETSASPEPMKRPITKFEASVYRLTKLIPAGGPTPLTSPPAVAVAACGQPLSPRTLTHAFKQSVL